MSLGNVETKLDEGRKRSGWSAMQIGHQCVEMEYVLNQCISLIITSYITCIHANEL